MGRIESSQEPRGKRSRRIGDHAKKKKKPAIGEEEKAGGGGWNGEAQTFGDSRIGTFWASTITGGRTSMI